jgi:hypothetical protein
MADARIGSAAALPTRDGSARPGRMASARKTKRTRDFVRLQLVRFLSAGATGLSGPRCGGAGPEGQPSGCGNRTNPGLPARRPWSVPGRSVAALLRPVGAAAGSVGRFLALLVDHFTGILRRAFVARGERAGQGNEHRAPDETIPQPVHRGFLHQTT